MACFSLAHSPKSIKRQRSLQNGRKLDAVDHSTSFLQVGHLTDLLTRHNKQAENQDRLKIESGVCHPVEA